MRWAMALCFAAFAAGGCATGDNFKGSGGAGGQGGNSGGGPMGGTAMGGGGAGDTTTATTSSGMGGATTTSGTGGDPTTTTTTSSGMTTTTTSSGGCAANEHECAGQCVGNTPNTGCLQSVSCTPCPVPANGSATCTAAGACDINCAVGYTKNGNVCMCAQQCCSVADCPAGETCSGGMCSGGGSSVSSTSSGGGMCDPNDCQAMCFAQCFIQMKFGLGICDANGNCGCTCM